MNHDKLVICARSFQPHFQAALRPARWNSDPRPTHPGQTAGKGGCLEKCIKMQCQSDTSCNFVEPGDHTQDALPKFLVGLTRSKFCFPLKHSNEWMVQCFIFESHGRVPTSSSFSRSFFARYPIGHSSDVSPRAFCNLVTLRPQTIISCTGRERLFSMFEIVDTLYRLCEISIV